MLFGIQTFFRGNSQVIKLCMLLYGSKFVRFSRVVVACRHAYRHQASTAWLLSSGWFFHPSKVSSPPFCRLFRLHSSPSTSLPNVHQTLFGESLFLYVMIHFWLSASQIPWRITWNTSIVYFSWFSSDAKIGRHLEGKALVELERGDKKAIVDFFSLQLKTCH